MQEEMTDLRPPDQAVLSVPGRIRSLQLAVMFQPDWPKPHHSIHEPAQLELVALPRPRGLVYFRDFFVAELVGRDLR